MKRFNHTLIAGAICAVVSPSHVAICVAGTIAPDWFEYVLKLGNRILSIEALHMCLGIGYLLP